jgi:hypothetical protein
MTTTDQQTREQAFDRERIEGLLRDLGHEFRREAMDADERRRFKGVTVAIAAAQATVARHLDAPTPNSDRECFAALEAVARAVEAAMCRIADGRLDVGDHRRERQLMRHLVNAAWVCGALCCEVYFAGTRASELAGTRRRPPPKAPLTGDHPE